MSGTMDKIKILIIGDEFWISSFDEKILKKSNLNYSLEKISNINDAIVRLDHNSYDILLIQESFKRKNTLYLTKMAYAMTRPSIIICNNFIIKFAYVFWKIFSSFTKKYKISKEMINVNLNNKSIINKISYLAKNHLQYFDKINAEISSVFSKN